MSLIDTHVLIWLLSDSSLLSENARKELESGNKIYVSIASLWEIAIKKTIGKLKLSYSIKDIVSKCEKYRIDILQIKPEHLDYIETLPDIHNDPFDRLIISQALIENMSLITRDNTIPKYPVKVIW
jgi:PIN domain nuclease of toxin-antitoxin system